MRLNCHCLHRHCAKLHCEPPLQTPTYRSSHLLYALWALFMSCSFLSPPITIYNNFLQCHFCVCVFVCKFLHNFIHLIVITTTTRSYSFISILFCLYFAIFIFITTSLGWHAGYFNFISISCGEILSFVFQAYFRYKCNNVKAFVVTRVNIFFFFIRMQLTVSF